MIRDPLNMAIPQVIFTVPDLRGVRFTITFSLSGNEREIPKTGILSSVPQVRSVVRIKTSSVVMPFRKRMLEGE